MIKALAASPSGISPLTSLPLSSPANNSGAYSTHREHLADQFTTRRPSFSAGQPSPSQDYFAAMSRSTASANTSTSPITSSPVNTPPSAPVLSTPYVPISISRAFLLRKAHFPGQDPQSEDPPPVTMTAQPVQNGDPAVFQAAPSNLYNLQTESTIVTSPRVFSPSAQPIVPVPTQQHVSVLRNAHFPGQDPQSEDASPTTTSMTTQPVQNGDPTVFPILPAAPLNLYNLQTESTSLARPRVFTPSTQPIVPGSFQQHVSSPIDTLGANSPTAMHKPVKYLAPLRPASFSPSAIGVPATVDERRWRNVAQPQGAIQTKVHTEQARERVNDSDSNVSAAQTVQLRNASFYLFEMRGYAGCILRSRCYCSDQL